LAVSKVSAVAYLLIGTFLAAGSASAKDSVQPTEGRRDLFRVDDARFKNAAPLPKGVLDVLAAREEAGYARDYTREHPRADLNQFFMAVPLHLSDPGKTDYIVAGLFPLTGADCNWFWIVRSDGKGFRVVLFANVSYVELLESKTNGFDDIRTVFSLPSESTTRTYRYTGDKYRLLRKTDSLIQAHY
jgi:hypothetical protein